MLAGLFIVNTIFTVLHFKKEKGAYLNVVKNIRPIMFIESIVVIILVVTTSIGLKLLIPPLSWGWFQLLPIEGTTYLDSPINSATESDGKLGLYTILFLIAMVWLAMPLLVRFEEKIFRHGHVKNKAIFWQSVKFGFIHPLVMGLPLSVGFALIIPGLYLGMKYRKKYYEVYSPPGPMPKNFALYQALLTSSACHLVYNSVILFIVTLPLVLYTIVA